MQRLQFCKFTIVISGAICCKRRVAPSLWLPPALAGTMNKINVRDPVHSFSSSVFHNIWIKWKTTVGHVSIAASQRSLGNRSFPPVLWTERLHAASATSLIHHCLFPFPPQFYRGPHSWLRGKTDWNGNRVALSKADVWPEATGKNCDLSFDKMGRIRLICLMISNMFSTI